MTALLLEASAPTRVAPVRTVAPGSRRNREARACSDVGRPRLQLIAGGLASAPTTLYWTRRGLAWALTLVALVLGVALGTLVTAFLSVSDAAIAPAPPSVAVVAAVGQAAPGR